MPALGAAFSSARSSSVCRRRRNGCRPTSSAEATKMAGKVTDFRKAEIWLLGYPGILGSISQAERREVCSQGGYPQPVEKIGYFIPFGEGSLKNAFPYFLCLSCFLRKGNQVTKFPPAGKRLPDEEKELPAHWRRNRVSFRRLSKFLQDKPANTRYNGDTAREVICYEENPHRRHRHR